MKYHENLYKSLSFADILSVRWATFANGRWMFSMKKPTKAQLRDALGNDGWASFTLSEKAVKQLGLEYQLSPVSPGYPCCHVQLLVDTEFIDRP